MDPFEYIQDFLMLWAIKLDGVLQVRYHACRVGGQNHLSRSPGHIDCNTAQDMVGFLCCKYILLGCFQFSNPVIPVNPFLQACCQPTHGLACIHVWDYSDPGAGP